MRMQGLSLETIPPIHVPFRFFLTAPWLGVAAALVLLAGGEPGFSSQWTPVMLGATHLLTLGFMAMVMLGAMFQLVPVISGRMIPAGKLVATLVHLLLLTGVSVLAVGFLTQEYGLFVPAATLLLLAFVVFLLALGSLLVRRIGGGDALFSMRFAALSLAITVALGLLRAAHYAGLLQPFALANMTNMHLAWGLGGWVLLLVMGASYQVIPMFHVTPSYPTWLARALPVSVFLSLLTLSLFNQPLPQALAVLWLSAAGMVYGLFSIHLLRQRKRKIPDITVRFWRLSLSCLVLAALLLLALYFAGELLAVGIYHRIPVVVGSLMVYGFAVSVIMGMLQKIVPFLSYMHLQRHCLGNIERLKTLPHMGEIIPVFRSRWQLRLHALALLAVVFAAATGHFTTLAALLMAVDFSWLGYTLASATLLYWRVAARVQGA